MGSYIVYKPLMLEKSYTDGVLPFNISPLDSPRMTFAIFDTHSSHSYAECSAVFSAALPYICAGIYI